MSEDSVRVPDWEAAAWSAMAGESRAESLVQDYAQSLFDVWAALGNDTDGDTTPDPYIAGMGHDDFRNMVLRDAREIRKDWEEGYEISDREAHEANRELAATEADLSVATQVARERAAEIERLKAIHRSLGIVEARFYPDTDEDPLVFVWDQP